MKCVARNSKSKILSMQPDHSHILLKSLLQHNWPNYLLKKYIQRNDFPPIGKYTTNATVFQYFPHTLR